MRKNNVCIIIPARYKSSRFPGKPLVEIDGKAMIHRVWDICCLALSKDKVFVATDSELISDYCNDNSINFIMTSEDCLTGTDRVYDASKKINHFDYYANVQGDEPLVNPIDIINVIDFSINNNHSVVNAYSDKISLNEYYSNAVPKVIIEDNRMVYMSRAPIPSFKEDSDIKLEYLNKQVCIYVFSKKSLDKYGQCNKKGYFEKIEDIEILRFIELSMPVHMYKVSSDTIAVDYPDDVKRVESVLSAGEQ